MVKSITVSVIAFLFFSILLFIIISNIAPFFGLSMPPPDSSPGLQNLGYAYLLVFKTIIIASFFSLLIGGVINFKMTKLLNRDLRIRSIAIYLFIVVWIMLASIKLIFQGSFSINGIVF